MLLLSLILHSILLPRSPLFTLFLSLSLSLSLSLFCDSRRTNSDHGRDRVSTSSEVLSVDRLARRRAWPDKIPTHTQRKHR
uniref:Putative secreted protein n=1 Tax=Anopheles marajoara TaxID=58244 RepID=A0A2M4CC24_9DIPT